METMLTCPNPECAETGIDKGPIWMHVYEVGICGACAGPLDKRPATEEEVSSRE